jgi:hypothetical protein
MSPVLAAGTQCSGAHTKKIPTEAATLSPFCTIMVYDAPMAISKQIRRSVTLPPQIDKQIEKIAKHRRLSGNRVLVELVELGLEARKQKEKEFFELAERFRSSGDSEEVKQLGDELGRFVFGE